NETSSDAPLESVAVSLYSPRISFHLGSSKLIMPGLKTRAKPNGVVARDAVGGSTRTPLRNDKGPSTRPMPDLRSMVDSAGRPNPRGLRDSGVPASDAGPSTQTAGVKVAGQWPPRPSM